MIYSIDDGIELVKQYWAIKGKPKSFGKNAAFNELRRYLQKNSIPYSHEEALKWISDNKDSWSKNKFMYCRRAVFELNDMMTTGKIEDGDYIYSHDPFEDLSDYWQKKLNEYIALQAVALRVSRVNALKVPKREKKLLSIDALTALLAQPPNSKIGLRNKTIMILLYDSAIKLQELIDLNVNDINLVGLTLHVASGKGNKERTVAITELTAEHLKNYMSVYHKGTPNPESFLFYTIIKGEIGRISSSTIERFIQNYADAARKLCPDMPERVYPHLLRAERTTNLYRDGVDPILLARILGHADVETTKIYAIPSTDQMREVMEKVPMPSDAKEKPLWEGDEDEMARQCGLR